MATAKLEAPRPVDTIPLAAVKSYTIADLQLAEKREEMAIALRKLVAKIDIATNFSSTLGFAPVDLPQFSRHFLASRSSAGPSFSTPDPTPQRGMREIVMAIHFRAGGSRWVFRSPGEPIVSSRFG